MLKKILSIFSAFTIIASSAVVTACKFGGGVEDYFKQLIINDVVASSYAARSAILSTKDNINPTYTSSYYGSKKLKEIFPKTAQDNTSKLSQLYQSIFHTTDVSAITKPGAAGVNLNFNGTQQPIDTSLKNIFKQINTIIPIIKSNFGVDSAGTIQSVLKTSNFTDILQKTLPSAMPYLNTSLLTSLGNAFGKINPINPSDPTAPTTWTYNDLMGSATLRLSNFLNSLIIPKYQTEAKYFPTADFNDVKNMTNNLKLAAIGQSGYIENAFEYILRYGTTTKYLYQEPASKDQPKNFQLGLPNIIGFLLDLGTFISGFPLKYEPKDSDHLFDPIINNWAEKQNVLKESVPLQQKLNFNIIDIINIINKWFNDSQDPKGYNLLKIFNILFDNQASFNLQQGKIPQIYDPKGTRQSLNYMWEGVCCGLLDGAIYKLLSSMGALVIKLIIDVISGWNVESVIYKFLYDLSTNANDFSGFNSFLKVLETKIENEILIPKDIKTAAKKYLNLIQTALAEEKGPIYDNIYSGKVLSDLYKKLPISAPAWLIKDLPNIKHFFHDVPINDLLKDVENTQLPNSLYCINNKSIAGIVQWLTTQFTPSQPSANEVNPVISPSDLSQLFNSMGQTANLAPKVTGFNPDPVITVNGKTYKESDTSTISYAIGLMAQNVSASATNSGVVGGFKMLGYDDQNKIFMNNSVFNNLEQLYTGGGIAAMISGCSNTINAITNGMNDNQKENFLPKLSNNNFYLHPQSEWKMVFNNNNSISKVDFQIDFQQPSQTKLTYTIELTWQNNIVQFRWLKVAPA